MRRVLPLLAAIGLVVAISPATVAAAEPIRDSVSMTGIRCDGLVTDAGLASVYVEVVGEGSFASLVLATSGDPEAMPDIITDFGSATFDGSRLSATFNLVFVEESENPDEPPVFTPAGSASVEAILTLDGDLEDFSWDPERIGNVWERQGLFSQLLSVEGSLRIDLLSDPEAATELTGCGAGTLIQTLFLTNPNAFVIGGDQRFIECRWVTDSGWVEMRALSDDFGADFSELIVLDGDRVLVGLTSPDYRDTAYDATYELFEPATKGEIVGSATAAAALAPSGERVNDQEWVENIRFSLVGDVMSVDGSISITIDGASTVLSMGDADCEATDLRVRVIEKIKQG